MGLHGPNAVRAALVADPAADARSRCRANAQSIPEARWFPEWSTCVLLPMKGSGAVCQALLNELMDGDRLAEIRGHVQQQRVLRTPRFQREIEAVIDRCASAHAAHRPLKRELRRKWL
jgi:putative transposase